MIESALQYEHLKIFIYLVFGLISYGQFIKYNKKDNQILKEPNPIEPNPIEP
jgi:hypothetical protein